MPEEITLPEAPATVAELLPHLPLPADYAGQWGLVFGADLAVRLAEVQAEHPSQHYARPTLLTDGRYLLRGALLAETPNGLYGPVFNHLDPTRFDEIAVMPWADAVALIPAPPPEDGKI
jgi:hypothetical protein